MSKRHYAGEILPVTTWLKTYDCGTSPLLPTHPGFYSSSPSIHSIHKEMSFYSTTTPFGIKSAKTLLTIYHHAISMPCFAAFYLFLASRFRHLPMLAIKAFRNNMTLFSIKLDVTPNDFINSGEQFMMSSVINFYWQKFKTHEACLYADL